MKLIAGKRSQHSKASIKQGRREGNIPAIVYGKGKDPTPIFVDQQEFTKLIQSVEKGFLSTYKVTLEIEGTPHEVLVKEVQYHPTTYQVRHIDFQYLASSPITVNIPIKCIHVADCVGIKLGGVLRHVVKQVKVTCLPQDLPASFEIDIRDMKLYEKRKLSDLPFGNKIQPRADLNRVVIVIAKR